MYATYFVLLTVLVAAYSAVELDHFNEVGCDICITLVQVAKQYAKQEEPVVKAKLEEECKNVGVFEDLCKDLVNQYIDDIYEYINNGQMSDKEICQKIGLC